MDFAKPKNKSGIDYRHLFPKKFSLILSFIQLVCAVLAITFLVIVRVPSDYRNVQEHLGEFIFCGIVFGLSGATGIAASLTQRKPTIIANMIISIITVGVGLAHFVWSAMWQLDDENLTQLEMAI